jgi:MoaA/NifB/PqqE/SkfB family radical SAM enzyme
MSAFDITLGNIFKDDIVKVWKGDFASKMLHNGYLPSKCSDCLYKSECGWWSRMISHIFNWSYDSMDPLADLNNKIIR